MIKKYYFSNSQIFFWLLNFFIIGIFIRSVWSISNQINLGLFVIAVITLVINFKNRKNVFLFFCLLGLVLGIWVTNKEISRVDDYQESFLSGEVVIVKQPRMKNEYQQIVVRKVNNKNKENILINTGLYPRYRLGEFLEIECLLSNPENKYPKFNYIRYLAKDNIYQICQKARIKKSNQEKVTSSRFFSFKIIIYQKMLKVKNILEEKINLIFKQPEAGYLAGLLLGGEERLPQEVAESFRRTGTTHTVAVSGYNITILASFLVLLGIFLGFWRQKAFWLAILGIIFFVLMIGSPASAVRAAIMGVLILWAVKNGRLSDSFRAIILAAAIMLFFSPFILLYDAGFQLSFLAALSIVLIYGPLSEKMEIKDDFLELKSIFWITISVQLGVLGILIYSFESFSVISVLANLIILPLIPFIMLGGFSVILISFFSMFLAKLISIPFALALAFEIKVIEYLAKIPWSIIEIKNIGICWLVIYYLFFIGLIVSLRRKK